MKQMKLGEYAHKGNYHIQLDPNWPYLPVYLEKMNFVRRFLDGVLPESKVIDLGCGEGVLVKEFKDKGVNIIGIDANYESEYVQQGNILDTQFPDASFDMVLCLDVIEHLTYSEQNLAIRELARLLPSGGRLLLSVPNLAHLASRIFFSFRGELVRTSIPERHLGDRPGKEYRKLLDPYFTIERVKGIFPTFPLISALTLRWPSKIINLHRFYNALLGYPPICFLNIFECTRK